MCFPCFSVRPTTELKRPEGDVHLPFPSFPVHQSKTDTFGRPRLSQALLSDTKSTGRSLRDSPMITSVSRDLQDKFHEIQEFWEVLILIKSFLCRRWMVYQRNNGDFELSSSAQTSSNLQNHLPNIKLPHVLQPNRFGLMDPVDPVTYRTCMHQLPADGCH